MPDKANTEPEDAGTDGGTELQDAITGLQNQLKGALEAAGVTELSPQVQAALQQVREKAQALAAAAPRQQPEQEQPPGGDA